MYLKSKSETNKRQCTAIKLLVKEIIGLNSCIKDLEVNTLSQLKERAIVQGVGVHPVAKGESETHTEALSHVSENEIADIDEAVNMSAENKMS